MNLIIQGFEIATQDLKQLAKLSKAVSIEAIDQQAFKLLNADVATKAKIEDYCNHAQLDFGFIPTQRKLSDFGLVVMDMDSTLINIECIDEIADMAGVKKDVSSITEAAMRGEIDFKESLTRRVRLLKDLPINFLEKVFTERLKLSQGAEPFLQAIKAAGIRTLLVSGGFTFFTERLKEELKIDFAVANLLETANNKLTGGLSGEIVDAEIKKASLIKIRNQLGLRVDQVVAIGDGANDLKMLAEAGVSIAFHGKPIVRASAHYAINHVGLDGVLPLLGNTN